MKKIIKETKLNEIHISQVKDSDTIIAKHKDEIVATIAKCTNLWFVIYNGDAWTSKDNIEQILALDKLCLCEFYVL